MSRGRNMSKGELPEGQVIRTRAELELEDILQEHILPKLGHKRFGRVLELMDEFGKAQYARGYIQGGKDDMAI